MQSTFEETCIDLLGTRPWVDVELPAEVLAGPTMLSDREHNCSIGSLATM